MNPEISNNICPLIGNGINRVASSHISWGDIILRLSKKPGLSNISDNIESRPFTFVFDEARLKVKHQLKRSKTGVTGFIAKEIGKLATSDVHRRLFSIGFRHILTTNYDYAIEGAYKNSDGKPVDSISRKYNLFRRRTCGNTNVWHIHGEAEYSPSIIMGYDRYAGTLQRMRQYLKTGYRGYHSPFKKQCRDFDSKDRGLVYSWIDIFLRDDIHIIGLTLDYSEIDLWWILYEKARQRNYGKTKAKTYYYHFDKGNDSLEVRGRLKSLEALDVRIKRIPTSDGYPKAWDSIICELQKPVKFSSVC